jgi:hypothetical protein
MEYRVARHYLVGAASVVADALGGQGRMKFNLDINKISDEFHIPAG